MRYSETFIGHRHAVIALSGVGMANATIVALRQLNVIRHLPDPPLASFHADLVTTSPQSFVYHPDAFAYVMADLKQPGAGATATTVRSKALGFSIRMVEQYLINGDQTGTRLDILIGAATVQARLACRVVG